MLINMKQLLSVAKRNHFAIPAFNVGTAELMRAVMEESEELRSPVILELHPLEIDFEGHAFAKAALTWAENTSLPVTVHLDHGDEPHVYQAVRDGFTSVMIDGSLLPFEENIALTKRITAFCHPLEVSVEGEIGTVGATADNREAGSETAGITYSRPEDAKRFVDETGVDTLAIAIGTAHGIYPKGFDPHLRLDILEEITKVTDIPLVLHGGSSNPDSEIEACARMGVCKINISSDIKVPFFQTIKDEMVSHDENYREPFEILIKPVAEVKKVVRRKIELFGAAGKASLYTPDSISAF